jgi:two-component system cell cycle sensor histidine kinase/response regulator CckA
LGKQVLFGYDECHGDGISTRTMLRKNKTILLIDDEATQRSFMRRVLEEAGYTVLEGADCDEGLLIHSQYRGKIDVVVTDISLPGQNGYALVKTLLDLDPGLNAIFISGVSGAELCRFHGMATTDLHFLEKPFRGADLIRRVRLVLESGGPFLTRCAG